MHTSRVRRLLVTTAVAFTVSAAASGCADREPAAGQAAGSGPRSSPGGDVPDVLATIGDDRITLADVRGKVGGELDRLESAYQRQRITVIDEALQEIIRERVLTAEASRLGQTVDRMVLDEAGGSLEPSDGEIAAWYDDNRTRVGGRTLPQVRNQIADLLRNQRRQQAMEQLQRRLSDERGVKVMLEPFRIEFDNAGAPTAGDSQASVTLVEFSDFQCPFCAQFVPTLKRVQAEYGGQVRLVYRQYPITNIHPNAFKAAEASLCAHEQGKFWDMHDAMFQEQSKLTVPELKLLAGRLGLDQARFDACLDSGRHTEQIQNDLAEGARAGITGTPAVFVNGVELGGGAVPFETVARAIDRELAR